MSTQLVIRDGTPNWWNSPDIWVIPGGDPNGAPGQPVAGQPAFVWGRVHNEGEQAISGATVNFYWSNPATGVLRSNSTPIGSAFVDLGAGETKEVLCVIPWLPIVVNNGHECLVAEIVHGADPLPSPLPDPFDPPAYRQVAQKNLSVLAIAQGMQVLPIQLAAPKRAGKALVLSVEIGGELDKESLLQAGLRGFVPTRKGSCQAALDMAGGCAEGRPQKELKLELEPGASRAIYLRLTQAKPLEPRSYQLVHVVSRAGRKIEGGISFIVINGQEG